MKTRNRPNYRKKLVKTTTISVAVLVAAIMIFSAIPTIATPVNTTKMNKIENKEILSDPTGLDPELTEKAMLATQQTFITEPLGPLTEIMHGYIAYGGQEGPCYFPIADPGDITELAPTESAYFLAGGSWTCDEEWYGCEYNSGGLWKMDPDTGAMEQIGGGGTVLNGMGWDPVYNRMYGAANTGLYEYDIETGDQEFIGSFGLSGKTIIGLAINLEGRAFIWDVLFSGESYLWEVDLETGEATEVGGLGEPLVYAQDGAFDWGGEANELYLTAYFNNGFLAVVDIETAELTNLGNLNMEITASMFVADCIPPEHDVGVKAIVKPSASGHAVPDMEMELLVKNYGANPETFDAQMEIIKCEDSGEFLLDEDFSGGVMPENWTTDYWNVQNTNMASGTAPEARIYNYDQYYGGQYNDNYLQSASFDATGWEKITMSFRWASDANYPQYTNFYVKWRRNETSPWKDLSPWDNPLGEESEGDLYSIDCYGFGQELGENFSILFQYVGYYSYFNYFWLDDVKVEGCGGCAEYAELVEDLTLQPGEEMTVSLPTWQPSEWHNESYQDDWENYPVHGFTIMDGDQRPRNNDKWMLLELYYPWFYDIEITEIGSPQEGRSIPAQTFDVEATITNVGQFPACCIGIDMEIGAPQELGTLMSETEWDTTGAPNYYLYYPGYGTGWRDEHKSIAYYYGWQYNTGNQAGGDAPQAYLPYYYCNADRVFSSAAIDTSEYGSLTLNFLMNVNHYSGSGLYAIEAGYSHDGENWYAAWHEEPSSDGSYEVSVPIEGGSETTYIGFWVKGNPFYFNYIYMDNVEVVAMGLEVEWTDFMCQGDDLEPGQSRTFDFDQWTPAHLETEETAWEVPYLVEATIDVEVDNDPGNDIMVQHFDLDYWHDPALEMVTSPAIGGRQDLLWENGEPDGLNGLAGSYYYGNSNIIIDDFTLDADSTATGGDFSFMWNTGSGTGNLDTVNMFFFEEEGDCDPSMDEYAYLEVNSFEEELSGDIYFGRPEIVVTVEFDDVELPAGDWWVGFQPDSVGEDLGYMLTAENKGCEIMIDLPYFGYPRWTPGSSPWGLEYDLAWALTGYSSGPPGVNVYIQPGTESVDALAINNGVFQELDLTCSAEIWEFITEPDNGTQQYTDEITNIDLDTPLGGTVALPFDDFTFAYEGRYGLYLAMPDPTEKDDFPKNNMIRFGVGVDDTKPESDHALDPAIPDGENGWYVNDLEVTLSASDPWSMDVSSGVAEIKYQVGGGAIQTITGATGTFLITQADDDEDVLVEYWAIDNVGNQESHNTFTVDMDQTDPTIDLVYEWIANPDGGGWIVTFTATATDVTSGMDRVEFFLNDGLQAVVSGSGPTYQWSFIYFGDLSIDIRADAYDIAGNMASDLVQDPVPTSYNYNNQNSQQQTIKILQG